MVADVVWRWRHRRCLPMLQMRAEFRPFDAPSRVCRSCRRRLLTEELRIVDRWRKDPPPP